MPAGGSAPVRTVSIYDVAQAAGVAPSTVSRALSKPGRVSFRTAEKVREVAVELGYRTDTRQRVRHPPSTSMLAMVVADITNPVYFGMIRGAERTAVHAGYTMILVETQESEEAERALLDRILPVVDGAILTSSRMSDASIRTVAKRAPLVVVNRLVDQVSSVTSDNVAAVRRAAEHLVSVGHRTLTYLAGPEASWADGMRWRALIEAGHELDLRVRRIGPHLPTITGGHQAADTWLESPTTGVLAYNDLVAIGFIQGVVDAGLSVPGDVSVVGFDNIQDAELVSPALTTIASPLISLGSAAVNHLLKTSAAVRRPGSDAVVLPARLIIRDSTGPAPAHGSSAITRHRPHGSDQAD